MDYVISEVKIGDLLILWIFSGILLSTGEKWDWGLFYCRIFIR